MVDKLEGFKTIVFNTIILIASILSMFGFILPEDEQKGIAGAIIAIIGIVIRFKTTGPVFGKPALPPPDSPPTP